MCMFASFSKFFFMFCYVLNDNAVTRENGILMKMGNEGMKFFYIWKKDHHRCLFWENEVKLLPREIYVICAILGYGSSVSFLFCSASSI